MDRCHKNNFYYHAKDAAEVARIDREGLSIFDAKMEESAFSTMSRLLRAYVVEYDEKMLRRVLPTVRKHIQDNIFGVIPSIHVTDHPKHLYGDRDNMVGIQQACNPYFMERFETNNKYFTEQNLPPECFCTPDPDEIPEPDIFLRDPSGITKLQPLTKKELEARTARAKHRFMDASEDVKNITEQNFRLLERALENGKKAYETLSCMKISEDDPLFAAYTSDMIIRIQMSLDTITPLRNAAKQPMKEKSPAVKVWMTPVTHTSIMQCTRGMDRVRRKMAPRLRKTTEDHWVVSNSDILGWRNDLSACEDAVNLFRNAYIHEWSEEEVNSIIKYM